MPSLNHAQVDDDDVIERDGDPVAREPGGSEVGIRHKVACSLSLPINVHTPSEVLQEIGEVACADRRQSRGPRGDLSALAPTLWRHPTMRSLKCLRHLECERPHRIRHLECELQHLECELRHLECERPCRRL